MKNNTENQPKNVTPTKRTYKPRTPITKTYMKIQNDPFVFSC